MYQQRRDWGTDNKTLALWLDAIQSAADYPLDVLRLIATPDHLRKIAEDNIESWNRQT